MGTDTQRRVTLPPAVMASIKAISIDESMPPGQRLYGVIMMIWGHVWYESQSTVDPSAIALPEAQWEEIGGMLANGVVIDSIAGVNLLLDWMNKGPSGYKEQSENRWATGFLVSVLV